MAARLRLPTVAFAVLSICLSTAIIGTAGKAINFFMVNHKSNPWLLPIWPNHFENRELQGLVGISAAIVVLNAGLILSLFIRSVRSLSDQVWSTTNSLQLPANVIVLITSLLSAMCSLSGIIFQSVINQHAPARDTLQTWTCRWSNASINQGQGPPARFATICQETRFAFFATIPVFAIQLVLLTMAIFIISSTRSTTTRLGSDAEKGHSQHELDQFRQVSFETKGESSPTQDLDTKGVQFA